MKYEISIQNRSEEIHGFKLIKFILKSGDIEFGSVDVAWIPLETWERRYPNIWEYMFWVENWSCYSKFNNYSDLLTKEQHIEIANLRNGVVSFEEMERSVLKEYGPAYEEYRDKWVNKPYVEYVYFSKEHRNKGLAKKLYSEVSIWLFEQYGLPLWSGHPRTNEGQWLWDSVVRNNPPGLEIVDDSEEGHRYCLHGNKMIKDLDIEFEEVMNVS